MRSYKIPVNSEQMAKIIFTVTCVIGLMLLVFPFPLTLNAQTITKTEGLMLLEANYFGCLDTTVTFTCRIRDSQAIAIAWQSVEYIGSGNNQLLMVSGIQGIGEELTAMGGSTVAMLTKVQDETGEQILESTLRIIVTSSPNPSVVCTNGTEQGMTTFRFKVPATPGAPQSFIIVQRQCPNSATCYAMATWQHPTNSEAAFVTGYSVTVNEGQSMNLLYSQVNSTSGSSLFAEFPLDTCFSGNYSLHATNVCGGGPSVLYTSSEEIEMPTALSEPCVTSDLTTSKAPPTSKAQLIGISVGAVIATLISLVVAEQKI